MSRTLVAYFSIGGTTRTAAEKLAAAADADIFEIKAAVPYTKKDTDWMDKQSRSSLEMSDPDCRPELAGTVENIDEYDKVVKKLKDKGYIK